MPEAAEGGPPLAPVQDGDTVAIDLKVGGAEMTRRREAWSPAPPPVERSWPSMYRHPVQPLSKGAVLGDPGLG